LSNHVSLLSALLTFRLVVFVKHTATTDTYTLSLHDALPISDGRSLDWWLLDHAAHYRIHALVKELNRLYRTHESLWRLDSSAAGFEWLDADDNGGNTVSYLRFADADRSGDVVATVINFSGDAKEWVKVGLPRAGAWRVALDTSGFDEFGSPSQAGRVLEAEPDPWHGQPFSATVRLAALSTLFLVPEPSSAQEEPDQTEADAADETARIER